MKIHSIWTIIKFAFQNISRNFWLAATTSAIITLSLFALGSLFFLNAVTQEAIKAVKNKVDVSLYFKPDVSREQILKLEQDLTGLSEVKDIVYISREESLEKLREKFSGNSAIIESLAELESNPLGDTLLIKAKDTSDYEKILDHVDSQKKYAELIQYKNFEDNQIIISRITDLSTKIKKAAFLISLVFIGIVISVLINSLRVAIYSHREEIGIMRLVGGTNAFIRGPFWVESIVYVFVSSVIAVLIFFPILNSLDPYISNLFGNYRFHITEFFIQNVVKLWLYLFIGGSVLSLFSTSIATRRYLRV